MSKKRLRPCPAIGKSISPAECGENRISRYDCPQNCPFNPFGLSNYDQFRDLEKQFDSALMNRAVTDEVACPAVARIVEKAASESALMAEMDWELVHRRHSDGSTFLERWVEDGSPGLRNDGQVILRARQQSRVELIEVLHVRDELSFLGRDLLQPENEPALYADLSITSRCCRFDHLLAIAYPCPNYKRIHNVCIEIPEINALGARAILEIVIKHLGGSSEQKWLFAHLEDLFQALLDTGRERQRLQLMKTDFVTATANYKLKHNWKELVGRIVVDGWLSADPEPDEIADGFDLAYLCPADRQSDSLTASMAGTPYLGAVLLKPKQARLKAHRRENLEALRRAFEAVAGKTASFESERIDDLALRQAFSRPQNTPVNVPPDLLTGIEGAKLVSSQVPDGALPAGREAATRQFLDDYYRNLLNEPIPLLNNLTPSEALDDLVERPNAIEWVKGIIRATDRSNLASGTSTDINWLLKELKLSELDFPPPPSRPIPNDGDADDDFEEDYDIEYEEKPLPVRGERLKSSPGRSRAASRKAPFHGDSVNLRDRHLDRIDQRLASFPTAASALDEMERTGCRLIDELYAVTSAVIDDYAFDLCIVPMVMAWIALVPKGYRLILPPGLAQSCANETLAALDELTQSEPNPNSLSQLTELSREPELSLILWEELVKLNERLPKKERPDHKQTGGMMIVVLVAVNLLSRALDQR